MSFKLYSRNGRLLKHNSGQIQLNETLFIIIFIILIIVFGLVFFSQAENDSIRTKQKEYRQLDSIVTTQYVTSLTELKCSVYGTEDQSCFEEIKLTAFENLTKNDWDLVGEYYVNKLGTAKITIEEIYPQSRNWTIYNYTGTFEKDGVAYDGKQTQIPVVIWNPLTGKRAFGVLYLTVYNKVI